MKKLKKDKIGFVQIKNDFLNNPKISLKAKGLYAFMFSKPEGWNFSLRLLSSQLKEGIEAIRSAINELKEYGYIEYLKNSDGTGIYILHIDPNTGNPNLGFTNMVKPEHYSNKDIISNKEYIYNKPKKNISIKAKEKKITPHTPLKKNADPRNFEKFDISQYKNPDYYSEEEKEELAQKLFRELFHSQIWLSDVERATKLSQAEIKTQLKEFFRELKAKEDIYKPIRKIKEHFLNWLKKYNVKPNNPRL